MSDKKTESQTTLTPVETDQKEVTPLRCLVGSTMSGALALGLYSLTSAIATTFATKPITSDNLLVIKIGSAVRTLVVGVASLATFIFSFVAIGLILLAIQLIIQRFTKPNETVKKEGAD
ncbi:MAG: DUF3082 domain-containing protein [Snowella sp.]|nr:DUF3082 domain-containing protein [Snowella sp.]